MLFRIEVDVKTGERTEISQVAYRNAGGDVRVQDASEPAPDGYFEFDPGAKEEQPLESL